MIPEIVEASIEKLNFEDLDSVRNACKVCLYGIGEESEDISVKEELSISHDSILEFSTIEFYVKDASAIDLLYLSSFKHISILKQSFRRAEHKRATIDPKIMVHPAYPVLERTIEQMFEVASVASKNGWETIHENHLPMNSSIDFVLRTNLREYIYMNQQASRMPGSTKTLFEQINTRLPDEIRQIIDDVAIKGYPLDRMFSFNETSNERSENYESIETDITFKVLSQIIRERTLGINLENPFFHESLRSLDYFCEINRIREDIGLPDAIGFLPFRTMTKAKLHIPKFKYQQFIGKINANEPLKSFAYMIIDKIENQQRMEVMRYDKES